MSKKIYIAIAKEVFLKESKAILDLQELLTDDFSKAVELILASTGRLVVTGMGKSGHIGAKIVATLASTGTPSFFIHPAEAIHGDLGMLTKDDVLLAISNSGESEEIVRIIPYVKRMGIPLIGMAGRDDSTLAREADYFLNISVEQEACPLQLAPTSSTTATLAMGDALAVALMRARNFQPEHFAMFHPGGSRGLKKFDKSRFDFNASEIMTSDPKTISPDAMASEAEEYMLQHKIKELLVVENNALIGVVQLYDMGK